MSERGRVHERKGGEGGRRDFREGRGMMREEGQGKRKGGGGGSREGLGE